VTKGKQGTECVERCFLEKRIQRVTDMKTVILFLCMTISLTAVDYGQSYKVPWEPTCVTVADVNLDGYPDIILGHNLNIETRWGGISILLNDGKGNFTLRDSINLSTGQPAVRAKNIDSDPHPEIFALTCDSANTNEYIAVIWNGNPDSISLFPLNRTDAISGLQVDDLNGDGKVDVIVWSSSGMFWAILYNNGNRSFSLPKYFDLPYAPISLAIGDLDGDGRDDIAISESGEFIQMFLNKSSGFDTVRIDTSPLILFNFKIADVNNDGKDEIIAFDGQAVGTPTRIMIYSRNVDSDFVLTYTSQWMSEKMQSVFLADVNNDGYPDIISNTSVWFPNSDYELFHTYVLLNNGEGTFPNQVDYYTGVCSQGSIAADLNGDGWNDLITLNTDIYNPRPDTSSIHILFNDGTGKFIDNFATNAFWRRSTELGRDAVFVLAVKQGVGILAGSDVGTYHSTDNGGTWLPLFGLVTHAFTLDSAGNIYAGTEDDGIYRSTDNGATWVSADSSYNWVNALTIDKNGDIFVGCFVEGIYVSTDGGSHWETRNNGLTNLWVQSLSVDDNGDVFAGTGGGAFRSTDYGNSWTSIDVGLEDSTINCIAAIKNGNVLCGTNNGLYSSTNNGNNWTKTSLPENSVQAILMTAPGDYFVGTFRNGVYRSTDSGITWTQVNSGFLDPSILCLAIDGEGYLWAGGMGGELYRSLNSVTSVSKSGPSIPSEHKLYQNYPNPFNPSTEIRYQIAAASQVTLKVYDVIGREVAILVNEKQPTGGYSVVFDANTYKLSSGVYLYRLCVGGEFYSKKMSLIK
jgi:photosystem II stability/assembly factor-like uncharacterized protein